MSQLLQAPGSGDLAGPDLGRQALAGGGAPSCALPPQGMLGGSGGLPRGSALPHDHPHDPRGDPSGPRATEAWPAASRSQTGFAPAYSIVKS